jgi:hypothetical protein
MVSQPAMNANAATAISGMPVNQSRFPFAGQVPQGLINTPPAYVAQEDLNRPSVLDRFGIYNPYGNTR